MDHTVEFLGRHAYFVTGRPEVPCSPNAPCQVGETCIEGSCGVTFGPFVVPKKEAFVLGDNRDGSHDSRNWNEGRGGGMPFDLVIGKPLLVYFDTSEHARGRWLTSVQGDPVLLARAEMRIFTEEWVRRIPRFHIAKGAQPEWRAGLVMALFGGWMLWLSKRAS